MRRMDASALTLQSDSDQIYADSASAASVGSSPRSVGAKGSFSEEAQLAVRWDEPPSVCVKLMCSYGGRILPRPHDNQLRYVGGETRIVVVSRNITNGELTAKLVKIFGPPLAIKYQLPNEDLDALISVTSEEDLENMMEEYDRLQLAGHRSSKLRLFLFSPKVGSQTSLSDLFESNQNRESSFVDALNGMPNLPRVRSESSSVVSDQTPDLLSGSAVDALDEWAAASNYAANTTERLAEKLPAPIRGYQLYSAPPPPSMVSSSVVDAAYKGLPTKSGAQVDNDLVHAAPVMRQRVSENQAGGERQMPSMLISTADTFIHVAKPSPDQQGPGSIDDDLVKQLPAKGQEADSSSKSRTGSQERASQLLSGVPPMGQLPSQAPKQPAKSNASSEDLESGLPRQVERTIVSGEGELVATIGDKSTPNALDAEELKVLGAQSDNRVRGDQRNKLEPSEAEQSTAEFRPTDAAIRASSINSTNPDASKSGVTMQQVSSYSNKETAAQGSSSSSAVEPSLLNSAALRQSDPVRFAFYALEEEEEEPTISPTYATQGPVIQLPIALSAAASSAPGAPPPAATGEAQPVGSKPAAQLSPVSRPLCPPVFAGPPQPVVSPPSAELSPASHPISPPVLAVPPQPQLRRVQAPNPSPLSTMDASSPTPVTVYYSTAAHGEGLPLKTTGIPINSPMAQLQRNVSDSVAQHLRVPSPQRDYHAATAINTGPSMAALPSWFRGPPTFINNQLPQPIGSDRKPAGIRQTVGVPSARPPLAPVQYNYNMEQYHTYPAARTRTAAVYDPSNATYTLAPTNLGAMLPDTPEVAGVNQFSDEIRPVPPSDLSSLAHTLYQDVHDASADEPQDTGAAGRQFFVRN